MVELADVARHLEEGVEAGALARAEAVAQLLEVAGEEAGRVAVAVARLVGEPLGLGARQPHGGDERVLEVGERRRRPARARPRRRTPSAGRCARATAARGRGAGSGPRTRSSAPRRRSGASRRRPRRAARCSARGSSTFVSTTDVALSGVTATERDATERHPRDELDRVDGSLGRDAEARQQPQLIGVARVLDRGDRRHVDLARDEQPVELGRARRRPPPPRACEPVEDRRHVHVARCGRAGSSRRPSPPRTAPPPPGSAESRSRSR